MNKNPAQFGYIHSWKSPRGCYTLHRHVCGIHIIKKPILSKRLCGSGMRWESRGAKVVLSLCVFVDSSSPLLCATGLDNVVAATLGTDYFLIACYVANVTTNYRIDPLALFL